MILYNYSKGNERNPKMKGKIVMKNMVQKIQNAVIYKYGFEHPVTIAVFWLTSIF